MKNRIAYSILAIFLAGVCLPAQAADTAKQNQPCSAAPADDALWDVVNHAGRSEDYQFYLNQYPAGKYAAFALDRIAILQADPELALREKEYREIEYQAWKMAEQSGTESAYQSYLAGYPQGRFTGMAQIRLTKFQVEKQSKDDRDYQAWKSADKADTLTGYQNYLQDFPQGRYTDLADIRIKRLQHEQIQGNKTPKK
ncbi:MAG: hypothetical protein WC742_11165 [Gallionellaceae bacterium]|jgi:hypothetical protein